MSPFRAGRMAAVASLLSAAAALRRREEQGYSPSCACLNWKEVYAGGLATCGDGMELHSVGNDAQKDEEGLCRDLPGINTSSFFATQDHELCINADMTKSPERKRADYSWCYVSKSCHELGRGKMTASKQLKWRTCSSSKDRALSALAPDELFEMSRRQGSSNLVIAKMAYAFAQVKGLIELPEPFDPIHNWLQAAAREHLGMSPVPSNKTVLRKSTMEHILKYNEQVWEVYPNRAVCVEAAPSEAPGTSELHVREGLCVSWPTAGAVCTRRQDGWAAVGGATAMHAGCAWLPEHGRCMRPT
eukprot:CAMPEP_0171206800 /NCGR_PEP_ID=MMETSP0790-20130122/27247_1 /TAXON_ID=2925 /ORGANISM="Alexandrium catenella, Strain OF101" /LENGTH=301 /DNA_ID=CAMNT_0011672351 /DNA_START=71 /DNA_END=974 /DNA_ORIENTATION=-